MLSAQVCLIVTIAWLGLSDPGNRLWLLALAALSVTFFSATQDIAVDAYRRERFSDSELGFASSLFINGYRIGMLLASGGGLIMADHMPFSGVYLIMAACILVGICTTLAVGEPKISEKKPSSLKEAAILPLLEYFSRPNALWILAFILCYKLGDNMACAMTTPFYLELGFTKTQIGAVVKLFGFWAAILGSLMGGILMLRMGISRSLWFFGIMQMAAVFGFALLAGIGPSLAALSAVIAFENISIGMGTVAFTAFVASITDKRFTATQYALLTSLMGIPRVFAGAPTGFLAKHLGWEGFFVACALIAIPGLCLLFKVAPANSRPK
jgi:PAT family beta-lactamase induction signal transducer AmpG